MKPSLLVIILTVLVCHAGPDSQAGEYFSPDLEVSLVNDGATNAPASRRDYLLSYQQESSPKKYLDWLWKDPVNLFTRPVFWGGEQWTYYRITGGTERFLGGLNPHDCEIKLYFDGQGLLDDYDYSGC